MNNISYHTTVFRIYKDLKLVMIIYSNYYLNIEKEYIEIRNTEK